MKYVKAEDQVEFVAAMSGDQALDLQPLLGTWVNTNDQTRGITEIVLAAKEGELIIRAVGTGESFPPRRAEAAVDCVYGNSISSRQAAAFSARYQFETVDTHLLANLSLGLLVVASSSTFNDGSGRSKCFSREFFRR